VSSEQSTTELVSATRNGIIGFAGSAVAAVAGLLLSVIVGRSLGPAASGTFFVVVAVVTVVTTAGKMGADTGLVWALSRARVLSGFGDLRQTIGIAVIPSTVISGLLAIACFISANPLARALVDDASAERTAELLRVAAPFILLAGPALVLVAGLRGVGGIGSFAVVQYLLLAAFRTLLVAVAVFAGTGLVGAMWAWCSPFLVVLVVAGLILRRMVDIAVSTSVAGAQRPRALVAREFWRFSVGRALSSVLEIAIVWSDVLIVAALTGSREAGIYAAASRFVTTGTLVEASLRIAMGPELSSRLAVRDLASATTLVGITTQWIILLSWPLYIALAIYAPVLLGVFGEGFRDGAAALAVLSVAMLVSMATGNSQTVLLMSGRSLWQTGNKAVALTANIALNFALVPRWGILGAATAWAVTILVDSTAVVWQVRYLVGLKLSIAPLLSAMLYGSMTFATVGLIVREVIGLNVVTAGAGLAVSAVIHVLLLRWRREHFHLGVLRSALRRRPVIDRKPPAFTESPTT
jgi:O-antigen/teichoic acid export membrane protein